MPSTPDRATHLRRAAADATLVTAGADRALLRRALRQADRVTRVVREVLGRDVLAVYLHGSAVSGGLRPASDLDILAVLRRPTTRGEKASVIERILPLSGPADPGGHRRPVELTLVVRDEVCPWHYPPSLDLQYGEWWRSELERGDLPPWRDPDPDLALLLAMVLQAGHPLFGPGPADVLDPVPPADIRRALIDVVPGLLDDLEGDEANVLLTLARTWVTLATGVFQPKDAAADWVLSRLPDEDRGVLAHARAVYIGMEPDTWDGRRAAVRACAACMERGIARAAGMG
jgi:streptomycin 3"-adenylyltransferase